MKSQKLTADIDVVLTVAGVERELSAKVEYYLIPASRGYREKGGGQIDPDEPESVEIMGVLLAVGEESREISFMLSEKQLDSITSELLGDRDDYEPDYREEK